jgi:hypothetical protein
MVLITTFMELHTVAGRSRTRADRPHAVSGWPMLTLTCHAAPMVHYAGAFRSLFQNGGRGMARAWHGLGMACVNQTWPHCVNQMGKTQTKPLATWRGEHSMCELALWVLNSCILNNHTVYWYEKSRRLDLSILT